MLPATPSRNPNKIEDWDAVPCSKRHDQIIASEEREKDNDRESLCCERSEIRKRASDHKENSWVESYRD